MTLRQALCRLLFLFLMGSMAASYASPWGANYFPNTALVSDQGKPARFFDDLIKDKVVLVNFIYTRCVDTCPLETAQLVKVQNILGDRLGKDVFFYSISIDPEHDTPAVLAEYRQRFRAKWTFLTGDTEDITVLRKKLGLYVDEIQDGSNNHNVNMIIGNQKTGRWMTRSPFENPYVLADQMGNWLSDWKAPQQRDDYANAPTLRDVPNGENLFRTRCATCHSITGSEPAEALGPDLLGVTRRRDANWLLNWLRAPDQMLANKDPIALELFARYKQLAMPNMRLNEQEARDLLAYIDGESIPTTAQSPSPANAPQGSESQRTLDNGVVVQDAWIRQTDTQAKANGGYLTLINRSDQPTTLVAVASEAFDSVEMHEMAMVDGLMDMRELSELELPAGAEVQFAPGGKHLMLMGPHRHLKRGESVQLVLRFASGLRQKIQVDVADR